MKPAIVHPAPVHTAIEDFTRFEFKYVMNQELSEIVEADVREFMTYDGHVSIDGKEHYFVRSLYFDRFDYANFFEKTDGIRSRRKYRVRTYAETHKPDVPIFLEEKNRVNNKVFKYRTEIDLDTLTAMESGVDAFGLKESYPENELIDRFIERQLRRQENPVVAVSYQRRAFVSYFDINFRVTFDSGLTATPASTVFNSKTDTPSLCMPGYTIMEVKFARRIPSWFHRILQVFQLQRVSVSKYCKAIETCGLAIDLS